MRANRLGGVGARECELCLQVVVLAGERIGGARGGGWDQRKDLPGDLGGRGERLAAGEYGEDGCPNPERRREPLLRVEFGPEVSTGLYVELVGNGGKVGKLLGEQVVPVLGQAVDWV